MTAPLIVSIIAVVVSALATGISGLAWYNNRKTQTRLVKIEEAREEDRIYQSKKARLVAHIHKEVENQRMHNTMWKNMLRIENKGLCEARDIKLALDDKPVMEHRAILKSQSEVTQIGPQSHFDYPLILTLATVPPSKAEITWTDDSGEPGSYKTTLTMP